MTTQATPSANESSAAPDSRRGTDSTASRRTIAFQWGLGGLLAAPFAILPHELGHYLVLFMLGVPGLALHYSTVTWDLQEFWEAVQGADFAAAAAVAPIWGIVLSDAIGPLITYAIVAACCYGCLRWRPHPALIAIALLAQVRITVGVIHLARKALGASRPTNYDELRVSILTGIPVEVFVVFGMAVLLASGVWLSRFLPHGLRVMTVASMITGIALGLYLYARVVGPWLLP